MAQKPQYSEPDYALSMRGKKDSPWYLPDIEKNLTPETRQLLEQYSKVSADEVISHLHKIRDEAWSVRAYPCTGLGRWLAPTINLTPAYKQIQQRLKAGDKYLDVGAFMGQDLRRLVFDGAPSDDLYAVDIVSHWDIGFDLFRDRGRFSAHFREADILGDGLADLKGQMDIISITHVLHQWVWDTQVMCCKKLVELSTVGTLVVGFQIGNVKAFNMMKDEIDDAGNRQPKAAQFRQSPESFAKMWEQVSRETGTSWSSQTWLRSWEEVGWDPADQRFLPEGSGLLDFVITRDA